MLGFVAVYWYIVLKKGTHPVSATITDNLISSKLLFLIQGH